MTTADRLKQLMRERRLRQVDILKLAEPYCKEYEQSVSKSDLSQYVNGKVTPGQWKITVLSKALNVNPAWLMGYDVPIERPADATPQAPLRDDEERLVGLYRQLNRQGQELVMQTAVTAVRSELYLPGDSTADPLTADIG